MRIGVLGGGLTGLSIGALLNENGITIEVLEKEEECGGLMRSLHENGFTFDYGGSHIIFSKDAEALDFILKLLGENVVSTRRNTKILYKGRLVKYPFENGLADLLPSDNYECLLQFIKNWTRKEMGRLGAPRDLEEWCQTTFGSAIAERYLIPYNEKIWKHPLNEISTEWVSRIPNPPLEEVVKSSLGMNTEGYVHQLDFCYPRNGGIRAIITALEKVILGQGCIRNGFEITSLKKEGDQWSVRSEDEIRTYDRVVSTIPIHDLVNAIEAPDEIRDAAARLKYKSLVTIMIGLDTPRLNDLSWLYIPDPEVLPHRVSFPSNFSPCVAPAGKSAVVAEVTCDYRDDVWRMKDNEIITRVVDDLDGLGILHRSKACFTRVRRLKHAYVINDLNCGANMHRIKNYFDSQDIALVGRFSQFSYLNMDGCIRSAIDYSHRLTKKSNPQEF